MNSKLFLILTGIILITACAKQKVEPVHIRCENAIKEADQLLHQNQDNYDKATLNQLQGLIKAARIEQQHEQYIGCNDKAYRAIELMQPDRKPKKTD